MFDWTIVEVEIGFTEMVLGGVPKDPNLIEGWLNAVIKPEEAEQHLKDHPGETLAKLVEKTKNELPLVDEAELKEQRAWTGFKTDANGPYQESRQWKPHMIDQARILKFTATRGLKMFMRECMYVEPRKIRMTRDGEVIRDPDGFLESAAQVMTMQGPRSILARQDYVQEPVVKFLVRMLKRKGDKANISVEQLRECLEWGEYHGFGTRRSEGFGNYQILKFDTK